MEFCFQRKVVLVTGAGTGIGRAAAIAFLHAGATVYALSRTRIHLETLVDDYPTIRPLVCNLTSAEETEKMIQSLKHINIVINSEALMKSEGILGDLMDFDDIINANVKAALHVSQLAIRSMMEKRDKEGVIINVSSICSFLGSEKLGIFAATKAALDSLTKTLAVEYGRHGIRANSVNAGLFKSDILEGTLKYKDRINDYLRKIPLDIGRPLEVHDVVNVILFLASNKSCAITGQCIRVDGGYSVNGL